MRFDEGGDVLEEYHDTKLLDDSTSFGGFLPPSGGSFSGGSSFGGAEISSRSSCSPWTAGPGGIPDASSRTADQFSSEQGENGPGQQQFQRYHQVKKKKKKKRSSTSIERVGSNRTDALDGGGGPVASMVEEDSLLGSAVQLSASASTSSEGAVFTPPVEVASNFGRMASEVFRSHSPEVARLAPKDRGVEGRTAGGEEVVSVEGGEVQSKETAARGVVARGVVTTGEERIISEGEEGEAAESSGDVFSEAASGEEVGISFFRAYIFLVPHDDPFLHAPECSSTPPVMSPCLSITRSSRQCPARREITPPRISRTS